MADTGAMSEAETTHPATDAHDDGHGHAPAGEPLGPIDWEAWAYTIGGAALGMLVALALFIARGG
jgi:hypothetical protein